MIDRLPLNNEANNLDQWNYNRGWNDAADAADAYISHLQGVIDDLWHRFLIIQDQLKNKNEN